MFIWIDSGTYITALNKKFIHFSLFGYHGWISIDTENYMDNENYFENNNIWRIFINILDDFLKEIFESNSLSINKKNHINIKCSLKIKHCIFFKTEILSIKFLKKTYQIIYRVHGYWKWFAGLNDSTPPVKS